MTDLDLEEIKRRWLNQCGPCDYGMPEYGCTHPSDDYRPVIMSLVLEVERLRIVTGCCPGCGHQWWAHKPAGGDDVAQVCIGTGGTCTCQCRSDRLGLFAAATELLHTCYGCQEPIAVADQRVVTMPDAIEYWHDKCVNG